MGTLVHAIVMLALLAGGPGTAADWSVADLQGRTWGPEQFEGKVVLLDFWATWCPPCIAELPHLRRLDERFAGEDFVLIGVALDAIDRRGLRAFLRRHNVEWPQIHARRGVDSDLARHYSVEAVPATLVLDRRGRPVARDLRGQALELVIETLTETR